MAHRVSWYLHHGEIPVGMIICHKCDNPPCVNPDHLFLGTHQDNIEDKCSKGRAGGGSMPGESNANAKLTEQQVLEIRKSLGAISHAELARMYGVAKVTIDKISTRNIWGTI